jgi:hypothetical protein
VFTSRRKKKRKAGRGREKEGIPCLLMIVSLTIGFATILVKRARSKGFLAVLAHEVLGVPLLTQRVDTLTLDGLVTPRAPCAECVVEAVLAVRASFFLEKGASGKWTQALAAYEVVRMPLSVKCGDAFSGDWLVAVRAAGAEELLVASNEVCYPVVISPRFDEKYMNNAFYVKNLSLSSLRKSLPSVTFYVYLSQFGTPSCS